LIETKKRTTTTERKSALMLSDPQNSQSLPMLRDPKKQFSTFHKLNDSISKTKRESYINEAQQTQELE
jgi:hypothetical protein